MSQMHPATDSSLYIFVPFWSRKHQLSSHELDEGNIQGTTHLGGGGGGGGCVGGLHSD